MQNVQSITPKGVCTVAEKRGFMSKALYKYTTIKYIQSSVENGIYASRIDQVNDPFEGAEIENPDLFRIVCLTNASSAMLMWAYYGNHHGCRIEYDVTDIPEELLHEVEYLKSFQNHYEMTPNEIVDSLYKKGYEWAHEKESRAVYYAPNADNSLWIRKNEKVFLKAKVVSVMFGLLAGEGKDAEDYLRALLYLKEHPGIEVGKAKLKKDRYAISSSAQFDIDEEIKKVKKKITASQSELIEREVQNRERLQKWVDTSWVKTTKDRSLLAREPWRKFNENNWIIRNSNVTIPKYGNGLEKVEPYDLSDYELRALFSGAYVEAEGRKFKAEKVGCIRYADIEKILDDGTVNYPYPTVYCRWNDGSPFYRIIYIDEETGKIYEADKVKEIK